MDAGERMPVRLVQENGDTISLDATAIDITVERQQSNFAIPLMDAKRMGIDINQSQVQIEVQGVFADDTGQETTAQATAILDFYQPQQIVTWGQPVGGGGGNTGSPVSSGFNTGGSSGFGGATTGLGGFLAGGGSFSGGIGGSLGGGVTDFSDMGNRILQHWNKKYIDFPVAYWVEASGALLNPVTSGLQLWLKADSLPESDGSPVPTWSDSSGNGRNAAQTNPSLQPTYRTDGINGKPYIGLNGDDQYLEVPFSPFFNSEEFTIFTVAKTNASSGDHPIISSIEGSTGNSDAKGYALFYDASNKDSLAQWREGGTEDNVTTAANTIKNTDGYILTYTMDDTDADSESDTVNLFINGSLKASQASGVGYIPNTAANLFIGRQGTNYFNGGIYEIIIYNRVLTVAEREEVEGYLAFKYGMNLPSGHEYAGTGHFSHNTRHIRVAFDKHMVASVKEPYGFLNKLRDTGMTIDSVSGNVITVTGGTGKPNEWFEPTESERMARVSFRRDGSGSASFISNSIGSILIATVTAVNATTLTVNFDTPGTTLNQNDKIFISQVKYEDSSLIGGMYSPVIVIPVQNADTFDENAAPEKAVGPEFPTHEDGSARDSNSLTRTDEYITYLISKALTSSYIDTGKAVNILNETTMDKVFSVAIAESAHAHNCRLTITQQYASSLGALSDTINTTLGVGQMPVTQGFSGGRSGKRVKSGGDKVQDLLGILANSNNYADNPDLNFATDMLRVGVDFLNNQVNAPDYSGDYIRGIQIPYLSEATKGKNSLDSHVAQRNFFLTTEGSTGQKVSTINDIHASRLFSHSAEGHRKNGISGLVTNFGVHREAEMKAYEFSLTFMATDIIL